MAQDGGTRDGTFYGEIDRCRGSQGWNTVCSRMPERSGKDQGEDIAHSKWARAGSLAVVDLATSGAILYPPGVWFADVMASFSGVTFVLF